MQVTCRWVKDDNTLILGELSLQLHPKLFYNCDSQHVTGLLTPHSLQQITIHLPDDVYTLICVSVESVQVSLKLSLSLSLQQTKERVKLLIQLADGFCEKGHAHASEIQKWVASVDKRYRDFSLRMDKYRSCLEKALGLSTDSNKAVRGLWEWVCWYGLHGWSVDEQYLCCKSR